MLTPTEIRDDVERVIRGGSHSNYMTAVQILARLPSALREQLIAERRENGSARYTDITVISQAAMLLCRAGICEYVYIDARGLWAEIGGDMKMIGDGEYACFRIRRNEEN
jgi:hypothetical protein